MNLTAAPAGRRPTPLLYGEGMTSDHAHADGPADQLRGEDYWDERYRAGGRLWSGSPNAQLMTEAADLTPGQALDVGCGEGADAIWLADRGWDVTAVDISTVALERGAAHARQEQPDAALRIDWRHEDLTAWTPPPSTYDLVSAHFLQLPRSQRDPLHERLAAAVALGGSLLIVGHHPSDREAGVRRPRLPELFFTPDEVAGALDPSSWEVVVSEARGRTALDPDGQAVTLHDAVLRARRRAMEVEGGEPAPTPGRPLRESPR